MPGPAHKAVWHTSIALGKVSGQQDGRAAGATRISGTPLLAGGRYEEKAVPRSGVAATQTDPSRISEDGPISALRF